MKHLKILLLSIFISGTYSSNSNAITPRALHPIVINNNNSQLKYEHFTLPNGLQVFLTQNKESPRFYSEIAVRAGSKNDPSTTTGIAHYLEHMLFKGTKDIGTNDFNKEKPYLDEIIHLYDVRYNEKDETKRKELEKKINELTIKSSQYSIPGDFDRLYDRLGARSLNAHTSNEETVYEIDLPKNRVEQWSKIESNRFANPIFRLFQSELEAVYEEKNINMDNKEVQLYEKVQSQLYKKHQYGSQTTLGTVQHLKNPSLSRMYKFYNTYYVPNNMGLFISGDIDINKTKQIITKYFSSWKSKKVPEFNVIKEAPIKGVERVSTEHEGEESVLLAFRTVPYKSEEKPALTIVDMLLDSGNEGLIKLNLVNPQKLISAGSYPTYNNDYCAESLYANLKKGQTHQEAEKLLLSQLEKIKKGQFDFSLTKGIILNFEVAKKAELENNVSRVAIMRDAFIKGVSPTDSIEFIDKLKHVTKEQVIKAANKYFNNYVAGYRYNKLHTFPKIVKPDIEKIKLNPSVESKFAKSVEAIKVPPIAPKWVDYNKDFKVTSVAPGVFLYYVNNPINNLFSFSINYDYGDKHYDNFCYVMDELNFSGTGKEKPSEVKNDFFKIGVNSSYNCANYGFSLNLSGVDTSFEKALQLSESVMWKANMEQNHLKERINNIISVREDNKKDQDTLRDALNDYVRYDDRSDYLDRPTASELKKINVSMYPAMKEALKKQNFKIYYTGQLPMDKVVALIKKYHQPANITRPLLVPVQEPSNRLEKRNDKLVKMYFLDYKGIQSHISLIIPEKKVDNRDALLESVYNEYIGSIFYQEIRESRALAYTANSSYIRGSKIWDQDQMSGFIGTQADKTVDAIKAAIELYRNHDKSVSDFNRSKISVENTYRTGYVGFREILSTVDYWSDLGYDRDPRPARFSMLNKLQFSDLKKFINDRISSKNLIFTIVGDRDKINMDELKKLGDVEEVNTSSVLKE